ncbi:MAG: hypothetical protein ABIF87_06005 [Pseudomonadota bacterium]
MKKYVGIWVDHEKAFIVALQGDTETLTRIDSNVEGHVRLAGGFRSPTIYGPQDVASEQKIDRRREHHLREYYQKIVEAIEDARKILIFGPGEAKGELKKEIRKSKELSAKIVKIEPADKMTERQVAAKVRKHFTPGEP